MRALNSSHSAFFAFFLDLPYFEKYELQDGIERKFQVKIKVWKGKKAKFPLIPFYYNKISLVWLFLGNLQMPKVASWYWMKRLNGSSSNCSLKPVSSPNSSWLSRNVIQYKLYIQKRMLPTRYWPFQKSLLTASTIFPHPSMKSLFVSPKIR